MPLLAIPSASGSSWPRRPSRYWNNLPIQLILVCDFFLFPRLKRILKGTRFEGVAALKGVLTTSRETYEKNPSRSVQKRGRKWYKTSLDSRGDLIDRETMQRVVWNWNKLFLQGISLLSYGHRQKTSNSRLTNFIRFTLVTFCCHHWADDKPPQIMLNSHIVNESASLWKPTRVNEYNYRVTVSFSGITNLIQE